jgi:hypothetical protein
VELRTRAPRGAGLAVRSGASPNSVVCFPIPVSVTAIRDLKNRSKFWIYMYRNTNGHRQLFEGDLSWLIEELPIRPKMMWSNGAEFDTLVLCL